MAHRAIVLGCFLLLTTGCDHAATRDGIGGEAAEENSNQDATGNSQSGGQTSGAAGEAQNTVTRAEIEAELQRFDEGATAKWSFGEPANGGANGTTITGTWHPDDAGAGPIVFLADGTFKCEFADSPQLATGRYAIADTGLIVAVARHGEVRLGLFYRLEGDKIQGSNGPNPTVTWTKAPGAR